METQETIFRIALQIHTQHLWSQALVSSINYSNFLIHCILRRPPEQA